MGVRRQQHFVLLEDDQPDPSYASGVSDFRRVMDVDAIPSRSDVSEVFGWRYRIYLAKLPVYFTRCLPLYRALGGDVIKQSLSSLELDEVPGGVTVN